MALAFDKVLHAGLTQKLRKMLPRQYVEILKSYFLTEKSLEFSLV